MAGDRNSGGPMKRVNSKEDVNSEVEEEDRAEVRLSRGFAEVIVGSPKIRPLTKRVSMRLVRNHVFEKALRNPDKLSRAIEIGKQNHCAEDLLLFSAVVEWEQAGKSDRLKQAEAILKAFIEPHSPHEVCLSFSTRSRLLARTDMADDGFFDELKKAVVNDLRLSTVISRALLED